MFTGRFVSSPLNGFNKNDFIDSESDTIKNAQQKAIEQFPEHQEDLVSLFWCLSHSIKAFKGSADVHTNLDQAYRESKRLYDENYKKNSFDGRMARWSLSSSLIERVIANVVGWIFSSSTGIAISRLREQKIKLERDEKSRTEACSSLAKRSEEVNETFKKIDGKLVLLEKISKADEKMMSLFGGKNDYLRLPILDVSQYKQISDINKEEMGENIIMRGEDSHKRPFFAIQHERGVQTVYRISSNQDTWGLGADHYVNRKSRFDFTGSIISSGRVDERAFDELQKIISSLDCMHSQSNVKRVKHSS